MSSSSINESNADCVGTPRRMSSRAQCTPTTSFIVIVSAVAMFASERRSTAPRGTKVLTLRQAGARHVDRDRFDAALVRGDALLGDVARRATDVERASVGAAEHARERAGMRALHGIEHLAALGDAQHVAGERRRDPYRAFGVETDAVGGLRSRPSPTRAGSRVCRRGARRTPPAARPCFRRRSVSCHRV